VIFFPASQFHPETYLPNPDLWQAKYCVSTKGGNWAIAMFKVKFLWWVNLLFYEPTLQLMNLNHIFVCSVIVLTHIVSHMGWSEPRVPPNFDSLSVYPNLRIKNHQNCYLDVYGYTVQPLFKPVAKSMDLSKRSPSNSSPVLESDRCAATAPSQHLQLQLFGLFRIMGTLW